MEKKGVSAEKSDRPCTSRIFCAHESVLCDRRWLGVKRFQQFR